MLIWIKHCGAYNHYVLNNEYFGSKNTLLVM